MFLSSSISQEQLKLFIILLLHSISKLVWERGLYIMNLHPKCLESSASSCWNIHAANYSTRSILLTILRIRFIHCIISHASDIRPVYTLRSSHHIAFFIPPTSLQALYHTVYCRSINNTTVGSAFYTMLKLLCIVLYRTLGTWNHIARSIPHIKLHILQHTIFFKKFAEQHIAHFSLHTILQVLITHHIMHLSYTSPYKLHVPNKKPCHTFLHTIKLHVPRFAMNSMVPRFLDN
jgi:hypothetical protein